MKSLVGERRAIAAAVLSFYGFLYVLQALLAPSELTPMMGAFAALYWTAFIGVVAGWFWGRWYAQGMGYFGLVIGVMGMWQIGLEPVLVFLTATHALVPLLLAGEAMAAGFDGRADWRSRFHLDDGGVNRLGKSVVRAALSLPFLLAWALAPTQPGSLLAGHVETLVPLTLGIAGVWGLLRMRTWGLFALAGSAITTAWLSLSGSDLTAASGSVDAGLPLATLTVVLLGAAVIPFAQPMIRQIRSR